MNGYEKEKKKEQIINTAVKWWSNKIARPERHSNGASDPSNLMAMFIADMGTKTVTDDKIKIFEDCLRSSLSETYDEEFGNGNGWQIWLSCDYSPCRLLEEAAKEAGISVLNFPFKTHMVIHKDKMQVSDGYAQPYVELEIV